MSSPTILDTRSDTAADNRTDRSAAQLESLPDIAREVAVARRAQPDWAAKPLKQRVAHDSAGQSC